MELTHADNKAGLLLAALGVGAGAMIGALLGGGWPPDTLGAVSEVCWWAAAVAMVVAVCLGGASVFPRVKHNGDEGPIAFWGHVSRLDSTEALLARLRSDEYGEEVRTVDQLFHVSRILARKYLLLQWVIGSAGVAGALFILGGLLAL